ncbi:uncharacterized protein PGTG_13721 [Puccinia graminis f. sp. tritici CRL 75-36-700-3]|uniref:DUF6589 domain-containing protein n=1 Tax=Puccinia graminis f. sp. tritici (strain CRL 75-36-700-3 / race SCCL) TaxID=418459 RepID=E3KUG7_PUCGT|nr:uncharacterized protein PGTG_13721 [Puccinia graminis f. sp. tritici CRL 75-36-700-3]EFP87917.2 hypothetical protein PGTG_13721 [Puccinia graminis f. sp. tritici CRL 75-36-700-3]
MEAPHATDSAETVDPTDNNNSGSQKNTLRSKLTRVYSLMNDLNLTPKDFLIGFLRDEDIQFAIHRRFWATQTGWRTTVNVVHAIRDLVCKKNTGKKLWNDLILSEASQIVEVQKPPARAKNYYSSGSIKPELLTDETDREIREKHLVEDYMPFLFQLISHKLSKTVAEPFPSKIFKPSKPDNDIDSDSGFDSDKSNGEDDKDSQPQAKKLCLLRKNRVYVVSRTICSMIAFVLNRRDNSAQLANSLSVLACGVSNRVNKYLHYIGLTSSRRTAHRSLKELGLRAEDNIAEKLSNSENDPIAPFICIDNLDFEERIHTKSVGNDSHTFHGTWGYIHRLNSDLLTSVPAADLTLESYILAMEKIQDVQVSPSMLLGSEKEEEHWDLVLRSQIAKVLLEHIASPSDKTVKIHTSPPVIDEISNEKPDITMLKLMIASDNSAQGIGEVCAGIIEQSNLKPHDFFNRLQVLDGDLGSCSNVLSLRNQRVPGMNEIDSLSNLLTLLGGSHTLWNIGLAILELHYGNTSDSRDCGAWRWLDGLGIPFSKSLDKKDFTLMISNMEKIHEATILHCIMLVMGIQDRSLEDELVQIPSQRIEHIVELTVELFFSAQAKLAASKLESHKLSNLLRRLSDFASIVEGNRAMKSGDIGRVMNMWKRWSVIAIGVKKLRQYSIQLPRMIILINEILPRGLAKVILHSLFVAPGGRQHHFVAKDHFLENQNYWLKYFFNHTGKGTEIDRLKDVFSVNVTLELLRVINHTIIELISNL